MNRALPFVLAVLFALVWVWLATWFLSRRFGQPIPLNPFSRRKLRLNMVQNISFGVSVFGPSLVIFDLTDRWLRLKLFGEGSLDRWIVGGMVVSALSAGILFGLGETFFQLRTKQL